MFFLTVSTLTTSVAFLLLHFLRLVLFSSFLIPLLSVAIFVFSFAFFLTFGAVIFISSFLFPFCFIGALRIRWVIFRTTWWFASWFFVAFLFLALALLFGHYRLFNLSFSLTFFFPFFVSSIPLSLSIFFLVRSFVLSFPLSLSFPFSWIFFPLVLYNFLLRWIFSLVLLIN